MQWTAELETTGLRWIGFWASFSGCSWVSVTSSSTAIEWNGSAACCWLIMYVRSIPHNNARASASSLSTETDCNNDLDVALPCIDYRRLCSIRCTQQVAAVSLYRRPSCIRVRTNDHTRVTSWINDNRDGHRMTSTFSCSHKLHCCSALYIYAIIRTVNKTMQYICMTQAIKDWHVFNAYNGQACASSYE